MPGHDGRGTAYELSGPEAAPVVVLIHGLGLNRQIWQWHEPALAARYRVLSYDLFGHGESAPPPETASLSVFSDQLRDLLVELGIARCAIVGFSLGGMINRRFALDHPERAAALAILNSPHERGPEAQRLVEKRAAQVVGGGSEATIDSALERWFTPEFRAARPGVMALIRQWRAGNDAESYPQSCMVLAAGVTELIRPDPPITAPTLVMTGEKDSGSTPAMSRAIAAEILGAETIIVPRLQHMGLVEEPSLFAEALLRFLDRALG
jgi:pimeloyl-ACP methyl ester carboxylesterase